MAGLSRGELVRKTVHMSVGALAFAVRPLGPGLSAACAALAVLLNLTLLPKIGRIMWRSHEESSGKAPGFVFYPLAVLVLVLVFWRRIEVAAAVWGILAFGDGMASIVGMSIGRAKLPWNPRKSWAGTVAYWIFGAAAATVLLQWTVPGRYSLEFAIAVSIAAALASALMESLPQGLDDNLGVPLVTGLFLLCLLLTAGHWTAFVQAPGFASRLGIGLVVNLALGVLGYAAGGVNRSGLFAGVVLGSVVYAGLDWRGYLLLLAFFVIGTGCTKLGRARKEAAGIAQERGGRRGASNALAKTSVPAACAMFAATTSHPLLFTLAFAGALATAAADTASSEIGKAFGRRTFLITTFRPVPRGTEGAISLEGSLGGIVGAVLMAAFGAAVGLFPWLALVPIVVAAVIANLLESLVGATLESRGLLDNEAVNFLNTLTGALLAATASFWLV
ncbi:MAG: DUF92 domain-containing protein [Acidobacteriota bacterium]